MELELNGEYWEEVEGGVIVKERHSMRVWMALKGLEFEVKNKGMKLTRISSLGVLKEYFFGLKRTKAGAYEQLIKAGVYEQFLNNKGENNGT